MNKIRKENGFSAVEGLLIVIIIAMIAGVGYYVWHANKTANDTLSSANQVAQNSPAVKGTKKSTSTAPSSNNSYFVVNEWGVRAPYSGSLHLSYTFKHDTGTVTYVALSSSELNAEGSTCASDPTYGGTIERYLSTDKMLDSSGQPLSQTAAQYAATANKSTYAYVGNYYYFYTKPQSVCGSSQAAQNVQTETESAFSNLVSKLQTVPAQ